MAGTKLYCFVTKALRCEQLAQGCYAASDVIFPEKYFSGNFPENSRKFSGKFPSIGKIWYGFNH